MKDKALDDELDALLDEIEANIKEREQLKNELDMLISDTEECTIDLYAEMYHFSRIFLKGLLSKSTGFQNKFFEIIDDICEYFDSDDEKKRFQKYIEEHHSFANPGNILYSTKTYFSDQYDAQKLKDKIHFHLLSLFDSFEAESVMTEVPHIIVCISAPDGYISDDDVAFIRKLLSFERAMRGCSPVEITTVLNDTSNSRGISCFVACLK